MNKTLLEKYLFPFLIALVVGLFGIVLRLEKDVFVIAGVLVCVILSTFILDFDYIFFAYFIDPKHFFSQNVQNLIRSKNYIGALTYIEHHKGELRNMPIHSVLFQLILIPFGFYVLNSSYQLAPKTFLLSVQAQLIFEQFKDFSVHKNIDLWLWGCTIKLSSKQIPIWLIANLIVLIYFLSFLKLY